MLHVGAGTPNKSTHAGGYNPGRSHALPLAPCLPHAARSASSALTSPMFDPSRVGRPRRAALRLRERPSSPLQGRERGEEAAERAALHAAAGAKGTRRSVRHGRERACGGGSCLPWWEDQRPELGGGDGGGARGGPSGDGWHGRLGSEPLRGDCWRGPPQQRDDGSLLRV